MHEHVIETANLACKYGEVSVFSGISLSIHAGDFVGLIGPNGAGKTTFAKAALGMVKPAQGSIQLFGKPVAEFTAWDDVGYVPQKYTIDSTFPATVNELLENMPKRTKDAHELCDALGIAAFEHKRFVDLSGGEKQRVMTALALLKQPKLLILDEPSVGVDVKTNEDFFSFLAKLNKEKKITIIVISHDIGLISSYARSVICINKNVCCTGPVKELNSYLKRIYGKDMQVIHHHHGDESCSNT